ncbi:hypothetical protein ACA373_21495 [Erwinia sp. STN24]|jgi:hypothetical protein|uniref:hypothetical protein n=1 Tax=Erwinia sp. STN24 TaxID=3233996 RepID=UPI003521D77B
MMRTFIIAFWLIVFYFFCAPADQPAWLNLAVGALCVVIAFVVTGSVETARSSIAFFRLINLLMPYFIGLAGVFALARGIYLYTEPAQVMTIGGAEVVSFIDEIMPLLFCLTGLMLIMVSIFKLRLRQR